MPALRILFSEGFRAFFWLAGVFAVLSVTLWDMWLSGWIDLPVPAPQDWHAHEMIFGYGAAAVGGFFLTAVPNWTGAQAAPHRYVAGVVGLWAAGRIAVWGLAGWPVLVAVIDLAFLPVLSLRIVAMLLKRPKAQQMIFLLALALLWLADLLVHLDWLGLTDTAPAGLRGGLLVLCGLIMVLGGRVTPGFTRNAMVQAGREDRLPVNPAPLAALSITAALALPVAVLAGLPAVVQAPVALIAGGAGLARVALWRGAWTRSRPILWTLHLGYAMNALGLVAYGLAQAGIGSEIAALHLLGIGGVGGMTLAIMSRASLGHTGRPLVAPGPVVLAYALIPLAAALRFAASALPGWRDIAMPLSALLWIMAFGLFLLALSPVLWRPRLPRGGAPA